LAKLAKLPSCTAHARLAAGVADSVGDADDATALVALLDLGDGVAISSGVADPAALGDGRAATLGVGAAALGPGAAALPVAASAPDAGACAAARSDAVEAGGVGVDAVELGDVWLVARSTVTVRVGSGAPPGRLNGAGPPVVFGPDSSSGTTSTAIATRIDAPIKRSLTR